MSQEEDCNDCLVVSFGDGYESTDMDYYCHEKKGHKGQHSADDTVTYQKRDLEGRDIKKVGVVKYRVIWGDVQEEFKLQERVV